MITLSRHSLEDKKAWEDAGYKLPQFNIDMMIAKTSVAPNWVHFGAGNIFRSFIAALQQELLNSEKAVSGIVAVETFDEEVIDKIYKPYDNLSILALMGGDGSLKKEVIASIGQSLYGDPSRSSDWNALKNIFTNKTLQMVSFTITEKSYNLKTMSGEYLPNVIKDIANGPSRPNHVISKIVALAYARYQAGAFPIAFVSLDNCSHNGEKLQDAVLTIADHWAKNEFVGKAFLNYLNDSQKVSFPWTMIDKITPRPSEEVRDTLGKDGITEMNIICTEKRTFIAPFVNAEIPQYLVIEDNFPNGRTPLEYAGVLFTDRETVEKAEHMKVTTCLNPLHTSLAIFGCLLGYKTIAAEMKDPILKRLVEKIGYEEGMPVVTDPGILDPKAFIREVIEERFPNPSIPDTPQRIATDTSQKISVRFGETIKAYCKHPEFNVADLKYIPLTIAGWLRYLLGIDDEGQDMELSSDPMMDTLKKKFSGIEFGKPDSVNSNVKEVLSNVRLFGVDLNEIGLGSKIESYYKEMIAGRHAVRDALNKYLS